jgi:hypothetical protein
MHEVGKHKRFSFEGFCSFQIVLRTYAALLTHFFDGHEAITKLCILGFVDGSEATFADLRKDAIALLEDGIWEQLTGGKNG